MTSKSVKYTQFWRFDGASPGESDAYVKKRFGEHTAQCAKSARSCFCEFGDVFGDPPTRRSMLARFRSFSARGPAANADDRQPATNVNGSTSTTTPQPEGRVDE